MNSVQLGAYAEGLEQGRAETRELLKLCLEAFKAIPVAADSRKMLKRIGAQPKWGNGSASWMLARHMEETIEQHLTGETP